MEDLKLIELQANDLMNLPLFYTKIFYNKVTSWEEEEKLVRYNLRAQCETIRNEVSIREISKTINYILFENDEE
jgi:hypothetical protein